MFPATEGRGEFPIVELEAVLSQEALKGFCGQQLLWVAVVYFDNKRRWHNGLRFSLLSFMFGKLLERKGVG